MRALGTETMRALRLITCKGFVEEFLGLFGPLPRLSGVEVTGLFVRVSVCHAQRDESTRAENCTGVFPAENLPLDRGASVLADEGALRCSELKTPRPRR